MPLPKFDTRAKNALAVAQQIALQLGHSYIGSEHLLFGILSQPQNGLPFQMSFIDNISHQELLEIIRRQGLERMQNSAPTETNNMAILPEITEELQKCLDSAIKIAETHSYSYVGIEHLIYGVLETKNSNGKQLMNLTESSSEKLREILKSIFESYGMGVKTEERKNRPKGTRQNSALDYFAINLNKKVSTEPDFELVERDQEIDRLIQILSRKNKNNPILLGEPGVGKTAIVEGLAKRINQGRVPEWLLDKKILSLDIPGLLAGTMFRGEFEQRLKMILEEVIEFKDIILFIDEIHMAIGAGSGTNSGPDMVGILKPALARGEISVIGATTEDEFRTILKKDKAFERRFQPIRLEAPDVAQTVRILRGVKTMYENYHNSIFPEPMLEKLVTLADRFIPERFFPDKAIDVLDETLVRSRLLTAAQQKLDKKEEKNWVEVEKKILDLIKKKNEAILNQELEKSKEFEEAQKELEQQLTTLNSKNKEMKKDSVVTQDILERTISEMSGVPLVRISSNIFTQIKSLQDSLNQKIFGQTEAIEQITASLKRSYAGVNPHKGPIASFLLLGPTGVGKTELVRALTQDLYGDPEKYLLKIDMSEFSERHQMSRLLGAPAGYVGYEDAPQLTEFLRKKPYSVILFDEIEKGHSQNLNILLQMLEDGKITDAKGQTVSCQHALIFMTSNLGRNQLNKFASKIGFLDLSDQEEQDYQQIKKEVMEQVEKNIKPEILGRITGKIVFRPIGKSVLRQIIFKELGILQQHMLSQGRSLSFDNQVIDHVISKAGEKLEYGAREVKALVAEFVQDPIAGFLLDNPEVRALEVKVEEEKIVVGPATNSAKEQMEATDYQFTQEYEQK